MRPLTPWSSKSWQKSFVTFLLCAEALVCTFFWNFNNAIKINIKCFSFVSPHCIFVSRNKFSKTYGERQKNGRTGLETWNSGNVYLAKMHELLNASPIAEYQPFARISKILSGPFL